MNALQKAVAATFAPFVKAITQMRHVGQPLFLNGLLKRTRFDYRGAIGDGLDSSVVTAPVMWLQRALPEARLALRQRSRSGAIEEVPDHEMLRLVRNPNPFYSDIALWAGTVLSYATSGDAYWIKVRNSYGKPVELWWVPHWAMQPKASIDGTEFLSHYEYTPGTGYGRMELHPDDVVHFRHGINPRDMRHGLSPLDGAIREIFADLESSNFVASLLRNMGVPGVVISPKGGAMPAPEDVEATKLWFKEAFGGDNRGRPLVMGAPTDVQAYGFNPQQMNLSEARNVAEERVCACLGIPAAVVGFGAGLEQTKVGATMEELRKLAWHNGVLPLARSLADELQRSLLPDFQRGGQMLELYWDVDDVLALQEDENKQTDRKLKELQAGAITLWDYLTETGREANDSHKYYLRPISTLEVPLSIAGKGEELGGALALGGDQSPKGLPAPATKEQGACAKCGAESEKDQLADGLCAACHGGGKAAKHQGDGPHDHDLPAGTRRATPEEMKRGERFVLMLQRQERGQIAGFEKVLVPLFQSWGDTASGIAADVLRANGEKGIKPAGADGAKADEDLVRQIIELLNIEAWEAQLSSKYQQQYLAVARDVAEAIEQSGFGTGLPDPVMRAIIQAGGRRTGLLDLSSQTRQAVFDALAEGRAQGEGVTALTNRIANAVEGGHWDNPQVRARVIARTETKYAQNISTIENGKANGVAEFMVFDGRLGPGRSLETHIARNGSIVSAEFALQMAALEHPNGTLSFAPYFSF